MSQAKGDPKSSGARSTEHAAPETPDARRSVGERLTPLAVRRAFEAAAESDPRTSVAKLILGDRALEWWAAVGPLVDPACKAAAPPLPPDRLRRVVSDHQPEMFLWTGFVDAGLLMDAVDRGLLGQSGPVRFLDFGGGCGRVARHLATADGYAVTLADTNAEHVAYSAAAIPRLATFACGDRPPLARSAGSFDAALALSVFTHLSSEAYDAWLKEMSRILRPGGLLVATLHGPEATARIATTPVLQQYFRMTAAEARKILAEISRPEGFVYKRYDQDQLDAAAAGADYGSTFVAVEEAARRAKAAGFDTIEHRPAGLRGWQDLTVLRNRGGPGSA